MNQGRIWTVVSPNVGLPLFLGSVAVMSFTVHLAVLSSTTWMTDFFNGTGMKKAAAVEEVAPTDNVAMTKTPAFAVEVAEAPAIAGDDTTSFVLKVKPKTTALDPS
jgi:light-harvesting protein B-800-850 alpha chain